jgi:hypothetical protein
MNNHPHDQEEEESVVTLTWRTLLLVAGTSFLIGGIFLLFASAIFALNQL